MAGNRFKNQAFRDFAGGLVFWLLLVMNGAGTAAENTLFKGDLAVFEYGEGRYLLEIYLAVYRGELTCKETGQGLMAEAAYYVNIIDPEGAIHRDSIITKDVRDKDEKIKEGTQLLNWGKFLLPKGKYDLSVVCHDKNGNKRDTLKRVIKIGNERKEKIRFSDIQFASRINKMNEKGFFYKNGFQVVPNPNRIYGEVFPNLYAYYEIYVNGDSLKEIELKGTILNDELKKVKDVGNRKIALNKGVGGDILGVSVMGLNSGKYYLKLATANDESHYHLAEFSVMKGGKEPDIIKEVSEKKNPFDLNLWEEELDREFEYTGYLREKKDEDFYYSLNVEGKRDYLTDMWIDILSEGKKTEKFRKEYLGRVLTANHRFREAGKEGWLTNRGRVYLIYGEPDDIDRSPNRPNTKPFEIWNYYFRQKKDEFIFVDLNGSGDLYLIHSTVPGEIHDYEWERQIYQN